MSERSAHGCYHGGTHFLRIHPGGWTLEEKGYFQAAKAVPEDSKMEGLNRAAPFTWAAVSRGRRLRPGRQHGGVRDADQAGVHGIGARPGCGSGIGRYPGESRRSRVPAGHAAIGGLTERFTTLQVTLKPAGGCREPPERYANGNPVSCPERWM